MAVACTIQSYWLSKQRVRTQKLIKVSINHVSLKSMNFLKEKLGIPFAQAEEKKLN